MTRAPLFIRGRALALLGACGAFAVACGAHEEITPAIPVQPGAAARAMALLGHGGPNDPAARAMATPDAGEDADERPQGSLVFSCLEARGAIKALARVPCTVTIAGLPPATGPETDLVSENGKVSVPLAPGGYRVTASRGLEYARATWDVEVHAGRPTWGPNEGATILRRVVDTHGYLAVDLRLPFPTDAGASDEDERDAVFDDAADGVEVVMGGSALVARVVQVAKIEDLLEPLDPVDLDAVDAWSDRAPLFARLLSKHPATAIASAARTYVRVDDDGSLVTWSPARESDLVRGVRERRDVVLTTGPFLRVTANGVSIGGVARANADRDVEVRVHVECAPWVAVSRVSIERASGIAVPPQSITLRPTPSDARAADVIFHLRATADDAFVVLADGSPQTEPLPEPTRAMTGAIWVDADGDGESLGRR